jgi:predicted lipoprotein with Yx(FWY)xxD motif
MPSVPAGPSYFAVPSGLSPSLQGNIVAASISFEAMGAPTGFGVPTGGWALTTEGQIGGLVANAGGAPVGGAPSSPPIVAPINDAVAVAGNVAVSGWSASPVALVAIKSDGEVVAAQGSAMLDVPAEAQGLRTLGFFGTQGLFYGLKQNGQFVAWSYASSWNGPMPSVTAVIATAWTTGKPELVQAEMVSSMVGDCLIGLTTEGRVRIWDAQGSEITTPAELTNAVLFRASSSSPMGTFVAVLQQDGSVVNFAIGQSQALTTPATVSNAVNVGFIGFHGDLTIALLRDGSVRAWKTQDGSELPVPEQIGSIAAMGRNGFLRRADGADWKLSFAPSGPMEPGTVLVESIEAGVINYDSNYAISRSPSLILGFPLSVLARLVADEILSHTNNYGLATKPDLLGAVQAAATQGEAQGVAAVQSAPNDYNLYSQVQYQANRITGVAEGKSEVISNPTAYSLFTESSIMDMNLGNLMLKKGANNNALDLELTIETKDNLATNGWQVAERISRSVSMAGVQRQFLRVRADAPYVAPNVKVLTHPTLGNILTDGAGRVLYFFAADSPGGNPMFSGSSWPYVSVPAAPKADAGVTATLGSSSFGRTNGPFLTVNTRPAYTYAGDTTAGQANGHGSGWVWYTIKADGTINQ